jgi:TM2 domain-containing membrane protein YozV
MKKVVLFLSVLILSIGLSKASSFKLDAASMETKFAAAQEISVDQISQNLFHFSTLSNGEKDKVVAGLLGIACGGIGLHRFYMGEKKAGLMYVGALCGMSLIYGAISVLSAGIGTLLYPILFIPHLIGVIDGIMYFVASDDEFQQKYMGNDKFIQWL